MSRDSRDLDDSTRFMLETYRRDIDKLDEKWDEYLVAAIRLEESQKTMSEQIRKMTKLLTEDNGKPSIVSQISNIHNDLSNMHNDLSAIKNDLTQIRTSLGVQTPKEVSVERWKTVGKIAAAAAATIPGILAFIHSFL